MQKEAGMRSRAEGNRSPKSKSRSLVFTGNSGLANGNRVGLHRFQIRLILTCSGLGVRVGFLVAMMSLVVAIRRGRFDQSHGEVSYPNSTYQAALSFRVASGLDGWRDGRALRLKGAFL